jgi:hypothetical protein
MGRLSITRFFGVLVGLFLSFVTIPNLSAQSQEPGPTFYEEYLGSVNIFGQTTVLDLSGGYNFNEHFGLDVGLPVHFLDRQGQNALPFASFPQGWNNGFGDAYLNLRYNAPNNWVNFTSLARAFAPTGSFDRGYSTGRLTVDWDNHFDHTFGPATPFADFSYGNTLGDRNYFVRPFDTLGQVFQLQGGSSVKVAPRTFVGGSWYHVFPVGTQKIYSELVTQATGSTRAPVTDSRFFESRFETVGPASILRDNGFGGWVGVKTTHNTDFEVGYSRSTQYALDSLTFRIGFNAGSLVKRVTAPL